MLREGAMKLSKLHEAERGDTSKIVAISPGRS